MSLSSELLPGVPLVESPLFDQSLEAMGLAPHERDIAIALNRRGYAVFDFPDAMLGARIERIKANLAPRYTIDLTSPDSVKAQDNQRVQDAWRFDEDVRAIAVNAEVLELLGKLYGRRAIPFQTLNFPVGTQQHFHSDSIHFSSQPERFMCGVWLALEDIHADAGPLEYCPGSHTWPIVTNLAIGQRRWADRSGGPQTPYEPVWRELIAASGNGVERFLARKGQALIWAANLLHGGSRQADPTRTRWSQVTHYYFEDCIYYTPAYSEEALGRFEVRAITNIATGRVVPNRFMGEEIAPPPRERRKNWLDRLRPTAGGGSALPRDFDAQAYYRLNPDVAAVGEDAASHYLNYGRDEGRRYRAD